MRGRRRDALIAFVRIVSARRGRRVHILSFCHSRFAFENGFLGRAQTRFRHDLDHGAVSFLRGDIRSADFRGRQAPEIPARRGRRVYIMKAMIELELKKIRRALNWFAVPVWKWDRAAAVKAL